MKIVLVRPNYKSHIITPPIGLGYLASYLKKYDIQAKIIDGLRDATPNEILVKQILAENPDAVGITCLTAFYKEAVDLSLRLKKENVKIIMGGVHPTFLARQTLKDSKCDFVIVGEGEKALLKLIQNNFIPNGIKGVYCEENLKNASECLEKAEIIANLDELPFPDWEQLDPNKYPKAPHGAIVKNFPIGVIMTTRGCPYECSFCASPGFYDKKIRFRTPENIISEIKYLIDTFGVREIHFEDDNLTIDRKHVEKICNLILEHGINISWACPNGIRADKIDEELLYLMKKSGCYYFAYGIESANQKIIDGVKKREKIETIEKSINMAAKAGISCQGFFIFGLPGETKDTIEQTIRFAKKSKLARAQFLILDVLPGSELWCSLKGKFTPNWTKESYKEPEWIPQGLTKRQLMQAQSRAFREFYFKSPMRLIKLALSIRPSQIKYLLKRISNYRILPKISFGKKSGKCF
ncbi:MAG TPA: radical SAM protein [Elusimicrobiales bacterium]|nr:radical SAM protein [Elusimicrobiales bacterium]